MPWDAHPHLSARSSSQPVMIRGWIFPGWLGGFSLSLYAKLVAELAELQYARGIVLVFHP